MLWLRSLFNLVVNSVSCKLFSETLLVVVQYLLGIITGQFELTRCQSMLQLRSLFWFVVLFILLARCGSSLSSNPLLAAGGHLNLMYSRCSPGILVHVIAGSFHFVFPAAICLVSNFVWTRYHSSNRVKSRSPLAVLWFESSVSNACSYINVVSFLSLAQPWFLSIIFVTRPLSKSQLRIFITPSMVGTDTSLHMHCNFFSYFCFLQPPS